MWSSMQSSWRLSESSVRIGLVLYKTIAAEFPGQSVRIVSANAALQHTRYRVIETWSDLPAPAVFAVLTALYAATGVLIVWATYGALLGEKTRRFDGVV